MYVCVRVWAAENARKVADITWQFDETSDLSAPTIWDHGMPEGDENEKHGFSNVVEGNVVLREKSGSLRRIEPDRDGHLLIQASGQSGKGQLYGKSATGEEEVQVAL